MRYIILVAFALSIPLSAQPVVSPGGVLNTASFIVDGLPNSGVAQGSMFAVFGQNLGPDGLVRAAGFPLPTELAGTSMEVTVNGTVVTPFLLFTFSGQLAGVLPSDTPLGQGTLTVTFNGATSEPVAIEVVKSAFGMFTRNQAGFGPAIVQNFVSATEAPTNALTEAAAPGQAEILWGSGLGPITESDAGLPPVGNLPVEVKVLVEGISVTPFYAGRSPQFPAVDQINFFVPAGIEGCYVPVAVKVDGVVSNYGTMAVASKARSVAMQPVFQRPISKPRWVEVGRGSGRSRSPGYAGWSFFRKLDCLTLSSALARERFAASPSRGSWP